MKRTRLPKPLPNTRWMQDASEGGEVHLIHTKGRRWRHPLLPTAEQTICKRSIPPAKRIDPEALICPECGLILEARRSSRTI